MKSYATKIVVALTLGAALMALLPSSGLARRTPGPIIYGAPTGYNARPAEGRYYYDPYAYSYGSRPYYYQPYSYTGTYYYYPSYGYSPPSGYYYYPTYSYYPY